VNTRKSALTALALVTALGAGSFAALQPELAAAQTAAPAAPAAQAPQRPARQHLDFARRLDGRIAYLKATLQITPAQEPQWEKVVQAMRQDAQERQKAFEEMRAHRNDPKTAVSRLEMSGRLATVRAQQTERFLAAFRPLYSSLSDDQKHAADEVLSRHFGHHHHGHA
jgi:LTXXQ motif family protein